MIRVLLVSNTFPSDQNRYSGVYISKQFVALRHAAGSELVVNIYSMSRRYTNSLGSIAKYAVFLLGFIPSLLRTHDIIHIHFFYPTVFLGVLYKLVHKRAKVCVSFHGSDINRLPGGVHRWAARILSEHVDLYLPVSHSLKNTCLSILSRKPTKVMCAGVDRQIFAPKNLPKIYDILFVGNLIRVKGIDILLEGLREENYRLCIVGRGEIVALPECVVEHRAFVPQEELGNYYNSSQLVVVPSRSEGFGLVAAEAMSCGTPVLCSNVGGLAEIVEDGKNGLLFKPEDPVDLRARVRAFFSMPLSAVHRMSKYALRDSEKYSLNHVISELRSTYQQLVDVT